MRLIDADALIERNDLTNCTKHDNKTKEQCYHSYDTMMLYEIKDMIDDAPTVDVGLVDARTVVHAEWVDEGRKSIWDNDYRSTRYHCSNCNRRAGESKVKSYKYCPNCGAKMDGKSKRND